MRSSESDVSDVSQFKYFFLVYSILCNWRYWKMWRNMASVSLSITTSVFNQGKLNQSLELVLIRSGKIRLWLGASVASVVTFSLPRDWRLRYVASRPFRSITENVERDLDITNGASGEIVGIVLHEDEPAPIAQGTVVKLRYLPAYVLVKFSRT